MRNSTTIDKEIFKWPVCLMLALDDACYNEPDGNMGSYRIKLGG